MDVGLDAREKDEEAELKGRRAFYLKGGRRALE